jgi:hypothetical protein
MNHHTSYGSTQEHLRTAITHALQNEEVVHISHLLCPLHTLLLAHCQHLHRVQCGHGKDGRPEQHNHAQATRPALQLAHAPCCNARVCHPAEAGPR